MFVGLICSVAVAVAALAAAVVLRSRLVSSVEHEREVEAALGAARGECEELSGKLAISEEAERLTGVQRLAAERRAEWAERAATEAQAAADRSREAASAAQKLAEAARADAVATADRAEEAEAARAELARSLDPGALWALEVRRVLRLWRDRLALPYDAAPFDEDDSTDSQLAAAVRVFAEASREESGVVVDLGWEVAPPVRPAAAVQLLRICEELIAAVRAADGGELHVVRGERTALELRTEPAIEVPGDLRAAIEIFGASLAADGPVIRVELGP